MIFKLLKNLAEILQYFPNLFHVLKKSSRKQYSEYFEKKALTN